VIVLGGYFKSEWKCQKCVDGVDDLLCITDGETAADEVILYVDDKYGRVGGFNVCKVQWHLAVCVAYDSCYHVARRCRLRSYLVYQPNGTVLSTEHNSFRLSNIVALSLRLLVCCFQIAINCRHSH
jgi:hypothetical protein